MRGYFPSDDVLDSEYISDLGHSFKRSEQENLAIQNALSEHPVVYFVKNLPVESTMYPAIEYLTLAEQIGARDAQEAYDIVHSGIRDSSGRYLLTSKTGENIAFRPVYRRYIDWEMPAHDQGRAERRQCGFIVSDDGGYVYTACPSDIDHHNKAKRFHCWGLGCPMCMNDTAIRNGMKADKHFRYHEKIWEKSGIQIPPLGHWVVSPPQEWAKCMVQDKDDFDFLYQTVIDSLLRFGAVGGLTIFHPWRQFEQEEWRFSPHFHSLLYGFIDTDGFRRKFPGWVIKKVHAKEGVQSIRHTVAYLCTHQGLAVYEKDPDDIDWDLDFLDHMIPGIKSKDAQYSEKDYDNLAWDLGRMAGDISDIDWTEWTVERLSGVIRNRYWGMLSKGKLKTLGAIKRPKYRVCKECGQVLRVYDGCHDHMGEPAVYNQDIEVKVPAPSFKLVKREYDRLRDMMDKEGMDIVDFAKLVPCAASTLELDLPKNDDIPAEGPVEMPKTYFPKRQNKVRSGSWPVRIRTGPIPYMRSFRSLQSSQRSS